MLRSIILKFTENEAITIETTGTVIFVGPNNSGKSLVLRETERLFEYQGALKTTLMVSDYEVDSPSEDDLLKLIVKSKHLTKTDSPIDQVTIGKITPGGGVQAAQYNRDNFLKHSASSTKEWTANHFLKWGVVRLDGRSRFNLTNDHQMGDLLQPPQNVLANLFVDDAARLRIRDIVKDAFGVYFTIDPTGAGNLRIKLSQLAPSQDEQSLNASAREYYRAAVHIKDASDGVQAFTGIITAVFSGEFHTILVDEPEAFLHPPLARKLGKHLAGLAFERGGTLMASTHSADFLMGCVQATKQVKVVRLEYSGGKSRGRIIDPIQLESFFKKPLIRSANVISGLFYDGVVVLESDNDRAFYSEIYHRLTEEDPQLPSILFVNAQNKQTIKEILGPLRSFGVPAAAMPDIDLLKDGGNTWTDWLKAAKVPDALHVGYGQQRESIRRCFERVDKDMKTDGGVNSLEEGDRRAANDFFDRLDEYGIFAVRHGEVESWLKNLNVAGKKKEWTVGMLERLGTDPASDFYVRPSMNDVWSFMLKAARWIQDSARKGLP